MGKNTVVILKEFIDIAERNRKYASNTAYGLRAALRLFGEELNDEEGKSLDIFKKNLEQISKNVYQKNKSKMTATTLDVYKKRVIKILNDYQNYGADSSKMTSWNPATRTVRRGEEKRPKKAESVEEVGKSLHESPVPMNRFELLLRPDIRAVISTPSDITKGEVKKIKSYVDFLETLAVDQQT